MALINLRRRRTRRHVANKLIPGYGLGIFFLHHWPFGHCEWRQAFSLLTNLKWSQSEHPNPLYPGIASSIIYFALIHIAIAQAIFAVLLELEINPVGENAQKPAQENRN